MSNVSLAGCRMGRKIEVGRGIREISRAGYGMEISSRDRDTLISTGGMRDNFEIDSGMRDLNSKRIIIIVIIIIIFCRASVLSRLYMESIKIRIWRMRQTKKIDSDLLCEDLSPRTTLQEKCVKIFVQIIQYPWGTDVFTSKLFCLKIQNTLEVIISEEPRRTPQDVLI